MEKKEFALGPRDIIWNYKRLRFPKNILNDPHTLEEKPSYNNDVTEDMKNSAKANPTLIRPIDSDSASSDKSDS